MARATKPAKTRNAASLSRTTTPTPVDQAEVLTLAEAAAYLRLPEAEVVRLTHTQDLPGRFTGTEWRFLKLALQEWLSTPSSKTSKEAQLAVAGAWKDDPYVMEELKDIYKRRGRSMTEEEP